MFSFAECSVIRPPADELKICPSGSPSSRTPTGDCIWHAPMVRDLAGARWAWPTTRCSATSPSAPWRPSRSAICRRCSVAWRSRWSGAAALSGRGNGVLLLLPPESADLIAGHERFDYRYLLPCCPLPAWLRARRSRRLWKPQPLSRTRASKRISCLLKPPAIESLTSFAGAASVSYSGPMSLGVS